MELAPRCRSQAPQVMTRLGRLESAEGGERAGGAGAGAARLRAGVTWAAWAAL